MANIFSRHETNLVKKLHRYLHPNSKELESLHTDTRIVPSTLRRAGNQVVESCVTWACAGRRRIRMLISLTNINITSDVKVKFNFSIARIHGSKHVIISIADCETTFRYCAIKQNISAKIMKRVFESHYIFTYGAPKRTKTDPKFDTATMEKYQSLLSVAMTKLQARSFNKNNIVHLQNDTCKSVLEKASNHDNQTGLSSLDAYPSSFTNLSTDETSKHVWNTKRYVLSILGMLRRYAFNDLMNALIQITAPRAVQKALSNKVSQTVSQPSLPRGTKIWNFHKSIKHVDPEWLKAPIFEANELHLYCKREHRKGEPLNFVAYEDIKIWPTDELAERLMAQ